MFGTVNEIGRSKAGNPKLKINGSWYPVGRNNIDGIEAGSSVEYETGFFKGQDGKDVPCLNKIRPAAGEAVKQLQASKPPHPQSAAVDEASLRFISNVVGSAITAGVIKNPSQVADWAFGALRALNSLGAAAELKAELDKPKPEHEFDDSDQLQEQMPDTFYQGLPPAKKSSGAPW